MKYFRFALLFAVAATSVGCYHAMVTTGRTPSAVVIDKPFASGWVYGLVPPSTVETASGCPDGVAIVETELSFVNQLVSFLTFGIYTPMHIKVTCAASDTASAVIPDYEFKIAAGATEADVINAFNLAADEAVASGGAVYVHFENVRP